MSTQPPERDRAHSPMPRPGHGTAPTSQLRGSSRAAHEPPARRRWSSLQLLGDQPEIEIAHADSVYRLRITSLGKLILTK